MLAERDNLPCTRDFFQWVLLFSCKNKTRYSSWFRPKSFTCHANPRLYIGPSQQMQMADLGALLEQGDFAAVENSLDPATIDITLLQNFLGNFAEVEPVLDWFISYLERLNDPTFYEYLAGVLLDLADQRLLGRLWREEMKTRFDLSEALFVCSRGYATTLPTLYAVDTLYPNLEQLANTNYTLADIPDNWYRAKAKDQSLSRIIFSTLIKSSRYDLLDEILSEDKNDHIDFLRYVDNCNSFATLLWLAEHLAAKGTFDSNCDGPWGFGSDTFLFLKRALDLHCSPEQLAAVVAKTKTKQVNLDLCLHIFSKGALTPFAHEQLAILAPLLTERASRLYTGEVLLLQRTLPERFNSLHILTKHTLQPKTLSYLLEKHGREVDWDRLVELYLYDRENTNAKVISLLLSKDVEINGFAQGLPSRWQYNKQKAAARGRGIRIKHRIEHHVEECVPRRIQH